jgi:hypothetical protein
MERFILRHCPPGTLVYARSGTEILRSLFALSGVLERDDMLSGWFGIGPIGQSSDGFQDQRTISQAVWNALHFPL